MRPFINSIYLVESSDFLSLWITLLFVMGEDVSNSAVFSNPEVSSVGN